LADYLLTGALIGIASLHKLYALALWPALVLAHILRKDRQQWTIRAMICLCGSICVGVVLHIAGAPGLIDFGNVEGFVRTQYETQGLDLMESLYMRVDNVSFYLRSFRWALDNPLIVLSLCGGILALCRREHILVIITIPTIVLLASLSVSVSPVLRGQHYVLMGIPAALILAGYFIRESWAVGLSSRRVIHKAGATVLALIMILVLVKLASASFKFNFGQHGEYVRRIALKWTQDHVPPGSKVLIGAAQDYIPHYTIPILDLAEKYDRRLKEANYASVGGLFWKRQHEVPYWRALRNIPTAKRYDLIPLFYKREWENLQHYLDQGVEYIIIRPSKLTTSPRLSRIRKPVKVSQLHFYKQLQSEHRIRLVKRFEGLTLYGEHEVVLLYAVQRN